MAKPIPRAAFVRQPTVGPHWARHGLRLVRPERAHVTASGAFDVVVDNPFGRYLLVAVDGKNCVDRGDNRAQVQVRCSVTPGRHDLTVFANRAQFGTYDFAGEIVVDGR